LVFVIYRVEKHDSPYANAVGSDSSPVDGGIQRSSTPFSAISAVNPWTTGGGPPAILGRSRTDPLNGHRDQVNLQSSTPVLTLPDDRACGSSSENEPVAPGAK
jgi:hypothetical protein